MHVWGHREGSLQGVFSSFLLSDWITNRRLVRALPAKLMHKLLRQVAPHLRDASTDSGRQTTTQWGDARIILDVSICGAPNEGRYLGLQSLAAGLR